MVYIDIASNRQIAVNAFDLIDAKLSSSILRSDRRNLIIQFINGDEIHFVPKSEMDRYCKGRTYKILGCDTLFHSNFL